VTIVVCHEIFDLRGRRIFQFIPADEVVGDFVLLGVCRFAIELGHRPTLGAFATSVRFRHGVCGSDRRVFGGIGPLGGFLFGHPETTKPIWRFWVKLRTFA